MAEHTIMKARPLGKDEVNLLLDLIVKQPIITTKATNATCNKLKEEAWTKIAHEFSAMTGETRRPEQLRLKWENLKKAARKRSILIRKNSIMTNGVKTYIAPDKVLDRVASILGVTCSGLRVEFGSDGEAADILKTEEVPDQEDLPLAEEFILMPRLECGDGSDSENGGSSVDSGETAAKKKRKLSEKLQIAQRDKELAMAAYFQAKAEKVELENKIGLENKIQLELKKVELELKKVELELKKVDLEIKKVDLELKKVELERKKVEFENSRT